MNWYTVASGGIASQTAPTPSTAVVDNTSYYVSAENTVTLCEGPRSVVVVSVKPIPAITLGAVVNPTTCNAPTGSISVTGLTANTTYNS